MDTTKKIAIVGTGSAGIQSICHHLHNLDASWKITSIYDPKIPILGIGESTFPVFSAILSEATGVHIHDMLKNDELNMTLKFGTYFEKWRDHEFINPLDNGMIAIHFNNFKLRDTVFPRLHKKWGNRFQELLGTVSSMKNSGNKVIVTIDNQDYEFDYVIDCTGFQNTDEDYKIVKGTVNHCLVHNKKDTIKDIHTKHVATKDGWMFVVPLSTRTGYGYLFNTEDTDVASAKKNFSEEINVPVEELDPIEYSFRSFYTTKAVDGRIIKNGNRAYFFEPIFSNSLIIYSILDRLSTSLINGSINAYTFNEEWVNKAESFREMIAFIYHGGSTHSTPFWHRIKKECTEIVQNGRFLKQSLEFHAKSKDLSQIDKINTFPLWVFNYNAILDLDKNFGYNYFK